MIYTVRYAHLESKSIHGIGDKIKRGTCIGMMGNSGQSTAPHLHIDCVEGSQTSLWRLKDYETNEMVSAHRQIQWFIDAELFGIEPLITTSYNDLEYFRRFDKVHLGYDLVPTDRHQTKAHWYIYWNRSMDGKVLYNDFDNGYGNTVLIGFKA